MCVVLLRVAFPLKIHSSDFFTFFLILKCPQIDVEIFFDPSAGGAEYGRHATCSLRFCSWPCNSQARTPDCMARDQLSLGPEVAPHMKKLGKVGMVFPRSWMLFIPG